MNTRMGWRHAVMGVGLAVVAVCAAVLSFSSLHELAVLCGFGPRLAPLLPVLVDAGAAASSFVWLGAWAPRRARRFARTLALLLLAGSVGGNALGHGLEAYSTPPHWLVVVTVSAIPAAVLGAIVHLAVLAWRVDEIAEQQPVAQDPAAVEEPAPTVQDQPVPTAGDDVAAGGDTPGGRDASGEDDVEKRALRLIAGGAGRPKLREELDITDHKARQLLEKLKPLAINGAAVATNGHGRPQ